MRRAGSCAVRHHRLVDADAGIAAPAGGDGIGRRDDLPAPLVWQAYLRSDADFRRNPRGTGPLAIIGRSKAERDAHASGATSAGGVRQWFPAQLRCARSPSPMKLPHWSVSCVARSSTSPVAHLARCSGESDEKKRSSHRPSKRRPSSRRPEANLRPRTEPERLGRTGRVERADGTGAAGFKSVQPDVDCGTVPRPGLWQRN